MGKHDQDDDDYIERNTKGTLGESGSGGQQQQQQQQSHSTLRRRGLFTKDLQQMMTAYGDVQHPHSGSVNTLEDILIDYISELCANALKNGGTGRDGKISADDIRFILRNDENKSARIEELLLVEKDITRVRKLAKS